MKSRKYILFFLVLFLALGMMQSGNYEFQITPTDEISLGPVQFSTLAADTYQYVDATQSETYGAVIADPPLGMGIDDSTTTNMTEGSYVDTSYTELEHATFGSMPIGWTDDDFTVTSGYAISDAVTGFRWFLTKDYDLSSYVGARIVYQHRAWVGYDYEVDDWYIRYYEGVDSYNLASVDASDPTGAYKTGDHSVDSTDDEFAFALISINAMAAEQIITDNWYIYGIVSNTYYRFEAVFRFDSVTQSLSSYALTIDFYSPLSGSDDLDFYIGTTPTPSIMVATDEQDDFDIDVTDYITASPIYLKIADNYRTGDTAQTTAYIQRCYLYTPGPGADGANWLDEDWPFRKQLPILSQSGAGTNYPVQVIVFKDDAEGAGNMSAEGHCNNDFSDIRFTARDGNTSLDYWLDHSYYVEGDYARFWVEVAENVSIADAKIYCYFGNPSGTSESSGPDTFLFFDDFEWNNLTRWTTPGAYWSTQGATKKYGSYAAYGDAGSTSASRYLSKTLAQSTDFMVHMYFRATDVTSSTSMYPLNVLDPDLSYMIGMDSADLYEVYSATRYFYAQDVVSANTWYKLEFAADYTNDLARLWLDDVAKTSQALKDGSGNDLGSMSGLRAQTSSVADDDMYLDDFYMRRWQLVEPTFDTPEPIEIQDDAAPVIAATTYSPLNPSALTGVTLFAVVTDAIGVEDVWFKAIAYPDGFEDVSYHAAEIGWNTWSYSFDTLDDGVYCFVTYAIDTQFQSVAAYVQYQMFRVVTVESIILSPITFFGVGNDFTQMQLSFDINRDCSYTIYESSATYEESDTHTGSVVEGWSNIAWDKIVVTDELVDFGIIFVNGSLSTWVNGSYSVAQTTFYVEYYGHNGPDSAANVTVTGRITKLASYTLYVDDVVDSTGTVSTLDFEITFAKTASEQAWHSWGIKFVNGSQTCWANGTYYRWKYMPDKPELGGQSLDALRAYQVAIFCLFAIIAVGGYLSIKIGGIQGGNFK